MNSFTYLKYPLKYSNNSINKKIVTSIIKSDKNPRYISKNNFIFDNETFIQEREKSSGGGNGVGGGVGGGGGGRGGGGGGGGGGWRRRYGRGRWWYKNLK